MRDYIRTMGSYNIFLLNHIGFEWLSNLKKNIHHLIYYDCSTVKEMFMRNEREKKENKREREREGGVGLNFLYNLVVHY